MTTLAPSGSEVLGTVVEWDDPRGWGAVRLDDGRTVALQCTDLADGTRHTEVGVRLRLVVGAGHLGLWHARAALPV